jgi:hypothetical protein
VRTPGDGTGQRSAGAVTAVGHKDDPDKHPVCKAVADHVGSGKRGTEVHTVTVGMPRGMCDTGSAI